MPSFPDFIQSLMKALRTYQLYGPSHPHWAQSLDLLDEGYAAFLGGRAQVQIATRHGRIFVDKVQEDVQNLQVKALATLLEDRQVHAILLYPGATAEELQSLLALLSLKPFQVREAGGAPKILQDRQVTHLRILATRLEEVTEAGEVVATLLETLTQVTGGRPHTRAADFAPSWPEPLPPALDPVEPRPPAPAPAGLGKPGGPLAPAGGSGTGEGRAGTAELAARLRDYFLSLGPGLGATADLSGFGNFLQQAGLDRQGAQPVTQGAVSQAFSSLDTEQRMGLFRSVGSVGSGQLRQLFGRLAAHQGVDSLVDLYQRGALSDEDLGEAAVALKRLSPNPSQWTAHLVDALRNKGMSDTQLAELVEVLTWDGLSLEQKLAKLMEGQLLFEMPVAKVLAFLRELLEAGRQKDFLRLLNRFAMGLASPAVARRAAVAKAFEAIADWADIPGMPAAVMKELMEILARAYGREKDPEVHRWFSLGVEHLLWFWVQEGSPERAEALFAELQDIVTELSLPAPWKEQATQDLLGRLGSPERIEQVLLQLFQLDREAAAVRVHPYLRMLGSRASNHLVERLWEEKDRGRRGRLLEALKDCGQTAEAPLLESLRSSEWFVVRNALVILGEIASPESLPALLATLKHADPRVVRAAVLAVGRLGGRQAEAALIPLVAHRDPATQMEVLFALADMKAKNAVPALAELCRPRSRLKPAQERVREKAVEILGKLGSPTAIPALEALLVRRKGFFGESREPAPIRILAFRALLALGTADALRAADLALSVEPPGEERDAFMAGLDEI